MSSQTTLGLDVRRVAGAIGARVQGLDLRRVRDKEAIRPLVEALSEHLVVFLPDQDLELEDLERITDLLGGRDVTPYVRPVDGHPHVIRVIKEPTDELTFANAWHSDLSYLDEPPAYTVLHAREIPPYGGDTLWANQYLAYETLSPGLQSTLRRLKAVHSAGMTYGVGGFFDRLRESTSMAVEPSSDAAREKAHPAVIRHPVTGRHALYVNPVYTTRFRGWTTADSQPLLDHLFRHSVNENLTCRLHWEPGTLAIWDNRCTLHNALNDFHGMRRELFRTSVKGAAPVAAE